MTKIFPLTNVAANDKAESTERMGGGSPTAGLRQSGVDLHEVQGGVITIGNFDGVHRGHAVLLSEVRKMADQTGGPAVAVVLDPHPATILRPEHAPTRLTWIERRAELMDAYGIDGLVVCETTRQFLGMTAEQFFDSLIRERLKAEAMVEGPNFFFGRDRGGDVGRLGSLCEQIGIGLKIVEPTMDDGQMISSTRIRDLLGEGKIETASAMLGHCHRIRGNVVSGAKRGREIGFPTANLSQIDVVIPAPGVYGGRVKIGDDSHGAAIHVGPTPTFEDDGDSKIEVHVLDYDGDLYARSLEVDFLHRVREITRFDSTDALIKQLHQDISTIHALLLDVDQVESEPGATQD